MIKIQRQTVWKAPPALKHLVTGDEHEWCEKTFVNQRISFWNFLLNRNAPTRWACHICGIGTINNPIEAVDDWEIYNHVTNPEHVEKLILEKLSK